MKLRTTTEPRKTRNCGLLRVRNRPLLLDLFCGGGGAAMGYYRAGFNVVGVDIKPQPRYPFRFIQADALEYARQHGHKYDAIHASPPCQAYSSLASLHGKEYPEMVAETRAVLDSVGRPYVIENVPGAPLKDALMLCGTMFDLLVIRHRLFETSFLMPVFGHPFCRHIRTVVKMGRKPDRKNNYADVHGHFSDVAFAQKAMGIDWMGQKELSQAIPPAYTKYIGRFLMAHAS